VLYLIQKLVEGKAKFQAGNIASANASAAGSSLGTKSNVSYGSKGLNMTDRINETKWAISRGMQKAMFWKK
jgi:chitin synthase